MGYTTDFEGKFDISPAPLSPEHANYLREFAGTRRQTWNVEKIADASDPAREAALLPLGPEGAYFTGAVGSFGQEIGARVKNTNEPPAGQPSLWCQWVPSPSGEHVEWDQGEKFYHYTEWLEYLIQHFLKPWGYVLDGEVFWQGEDAEDFGKIVVVKNVVSEWRVGHTFEPSTLPRDEA